MKRCLFLARKGYGKVAPNPMVGCVVVCDDEIIGEGWHRYFGGPHAEVEAVGSVQNTALLKRATVYVSLEPCAHFGKTPPCAAMLVGLGVRRVVAGVQDPNPLVAGKGMQMLKEAGIETLTGVLETECKELNRRFFIQQKEKRPYVILKWAESADAYIGSDTQKKISGAAAMQRLHQWRSEEDAFMVGTHTLLQDNPRLNTRLVEGRDPVRVAVDFHLRSEGRDLHFFEPGQRSILLNGYKTEKKGDTEWVAIPDTRPASMLQALRGLGINSLVVEGGSALLNSFLDAGLFDEVRCFRSKHLRLGTGVQAPVCRLPYTESEDLGEDLLLSCFR